MDVDETWRDPAATGVDDANAGWCFEIAADGLDPALDHQYVSLVEALARAREHRGITNQRRRARLWLVGGWVQERGRVGGRCGLGSGRLCRAADECAEAERANRRS